MQNGKQILIIPGKLPGLNDILDAKASFRQRGWKKRVTTYWVLKKEWSETIGALCLAQRIEPVHYARFSFLWIEPNARRDKDNVAAGGRKLIFDALVDNGVLQGDRWKHVAGWTDDFGVDPIQPRVEVTINELAPDLFGGGP